MNYEQAIKILEKEKTTKFLELYNKPKNNNYIDIYNVIPYMSPFCNYYFTSKNIAELESYIIGINWLKENKPLFKALEHARIIMKEYQEYKIENRMREFYLY